jgi:hypothetical protein
MKPSEKGWFKAYLEQRTDSIIHNFQPLSAEENEKVIYRIIQPSGFMYGFPVSIPSISEEELKGYEETDKMKLLLAESFLLSMYATISDKEHLKTQLRQAPGKVIQFYESLFPDMEISIEKIDQETSTEESAEELISSRLKLQSGVKKNFWANFFSNSLVFLDVYYFFRYLETHESINLVELRKQLDQIRMIIVKVIAAAAHANKSIEREEREVFNYFLLSAKLSPDKKSEARSFFENGATLDQLKFPELQSWLLKKYIIELATLTIFSDQNLEEDETRCLEKLNQELGLPQEELDASILAIESFVVENFEKIDILSQRQDYQNLEKRLIETLRNVLNKNVETLKKEFQERKELLDLLAKNNAEGLSENEEERAKSQLIEILKTIPAFILIALPGSFITFPLLLEVLPKKVLSNT